MKITIITALLVLCFNTFSNTSTYTGERYLEMVEEEKQVCSPSDLLDAESEAIEYASLDTEESLAWYFKEALIKRGCTEEAVHELSLAHPCEFDKTLVECEPLT